MKEFIESYKVATCFDIFLFYTLVLCVIGWIIFYSIVLIRAIKELNEE